MKKINYTLVKFVIAAFAVGLISAALPCRAASGATVGVIDLEALAIWQENVEMMGPYGVEIINQDILADTEKLDSYGLVILDGVPYNRLHERKYEALAGYVSRGGTLFMIGNAGLHMESQDEDGQTLTRRISGGGPLEFVTGAEIIGHDGLVTEMEVVERNCYTEGLPDKFEYELEPPYDITDERNRFLQRRTVITRLEVNTAEVLVEANAYYSERDPDTGERVYDMETPVRSPLLILNSRGEGKTVWLACRALHLLGRHETNIMRIVFNVLRCSLEK